VVNRGRFSFTSWLVGVKSDLTNHTLVKTEKMQFKLKTLKTYLLAIKNVAPAEKAVTSKLPSHNLFLLKEQNNGHD